MVETENYGKGFHFKPCYEFSLKDGKRFHEQLKRLEAEREKAFSDYIELYARRLKELSNEAWVADSAVTS